jgi:hypothetical protein
MKLILLGYRIAMLALLYYAVDLLLYVRWSLQQLHGIVQP